MPDSISSQEKAQRVEGMIDLLNLRKAADTIVGDSIKKGISGGERKRTAMGKLIVDMDAFRNGNDYKPKRLVFR